MCINIKQEFENIMERGDVVAIEHDWVQTFALFPHKTISGEWIWGKNAFCRRVWIYTGFIDESETQWGTIFDVLRTI